MTDSDIYLAASCFTSLGPLRFKLLIDYFDSPQKFYSQFAKTGELLAKQVKRTRSNFFRQKKPRILNPHKALPYILNSIP